jgi:hypothetical protein
MTFSMKSFGQLHHRISHIFISNVLSKYIVCVFVIRDYGCRIVDAVISDDFDHVRSNKPEILICIKSSVFFLLFLTISQPCNLIAFKSVTLV